MRLWDEITSDLRQRNLTNTVKSTRKSNNRIQIYFYLLGFSLSILFYFNTPLFSILYIFYYFFLCFIIFQCNFLKIWPFILYSDNLRYSLFFRSFYRLFPGGVNGLQYPWWLKEHNTFRNYVFVILSLHVFVFLSFIFASTLCLHGFFMLFYYFSST